MGVDAHESASVTAAPTFRLIRATGLQDGRQHRSTHIEFEAANNPSLLKFCADRFLQNMRNHLKDLPRLSAHRSNARKRASNGLGYRGNDARGQIDG